MKVGKFSVLSLLFLLAAGAVQAQTTPPTVVVRFQSVDALMEHVKFLVGLAGQKDAARQIEGLIKTQIGDKGLQGVDTRRPFGFYGRMGKELDDVAGAVVLPISDEKAFLEFLQKFNFQAIKGKDEIYTIKTGSPIDAYLRFANKYAYITALKINALEEKNLLDPATVLGASANSVFGLTIQLNQVPDTAKFITTAQVEQALQEAEKKAIPGETAAHKAFRVATLKEVAKVIASVLKDGKELKAGVNLDSKTGELSASFSVSGMPNSELAAGMQAMAKPSMFYGLVPKDTVGSVLGSIKLPATMAKALGDVVDEAKSLALANLHAVPAKKQAEAFVNALAPTFRSGDFDGALAVLPHGKHVSLIWAFKVKGGNELDKTMRDLVSSALKDAPGEIKDKVKLDVDTLGRTKIHSVQFPSTGTEGKDLTKIFGDPSAYVAIRNDAVFLAIGKDGLQLLKNAIPEKTTLTTEGPIAVYRAEVDVARLIPLVHPEQAQTVQKLFPESRGGIIRFTVEGGSAFSVRLDTKVAVLQLLGQLHSQK